MQIPGNAQEPVKMQESDKMKKSDKMQEQKKKSTTLNRIGKVDKKIRIRMWAAGIFFVCLVLVVLLQKFSLGQNYFVVTVNNKVVGCVSSKTDVEKAVHESRRQMAKESEGYLMQEISYETTESHKPFQKLLSETALKEKITKELKKDNSGEIFAYTVSAGENQLSFATLDEVETFLGRLKEEQDTDNRFEIEFKKETDHQEGMLLANLKETGDSEKTEDSADAGIVQQLGIYLSDAQENPGENNYETGILSMEFAQDVEVFTNLVAADTLTDIDAAVEEVTKEKETNKIYEIQPGDCLSVIAQEHDTSVAAIIALNGLSGEDAVISAGEELILSVPQPDISLRISEGVVYEEDYTAEPEIVPNDSWYTTDEVVLAEGTTGHREVNMVVTTENEIETERSMIHQTILTESTPAVIERGTKIPPTYIKPLIGGRVSSGFGRRWGRMHKGIDWACPTGTKVFASSNGVVVSAGYVSGYGNCVLISHPDGRMTRYAHNSKLLVKAGQSVSQGEVIALSGSTGRSTGPHVHFEILINGSQVNPVNYLN